MENEANLVLTQLSQKSPLQSAYFEEFKSLFEQKLWHQLSNKVEDFFRDPNCTCLQVEVFSRFLILWDKKMNPMTFVRCAISASRQITDMSEAAGLLESVLGKLSTGGALELQILLKMEISHYRLRLGDLTYPKLAIDQSRPIVESLAGGIDPQVNATFYRVSADYNKATASFSDYYKNSLLYLACITPEELPLAEQLERGHDLCVAALLGDSIYNFGELILHPILEGLEKSPELSFLPKLITAMNSGNSQDFDPFVPAISQHNLLSAHLEFIKQKMSLMALVELIFCSIKTSRQVPFDKIARAAKMSPCEVEFLLMKALSLSLIRGEIDEPAQVIFIEWVQPRVLDRQQIRQLIDSVRSWRQRVGETFRLINNLLPTDADANILDTMVGTNEGA